MTSPNLTPGISGASGASGTTPIEEWDAAFPDQPWMAQWTITPPVSGASGNAIDLTAGPAGASGASGASGATGRPTGIDGRTSITTDRFSDLPNRSRNVVSAVYGDALPLLSAWEGAADALFNVLMSGFTSIEHFLESLFNVDIDLGFLSEPVQALMELGRSLLGGVAPWLAAIQDVLEWFAGLITPVVQDVFEFILRLFGGLWEAFDEAILSDVLEWLAGLWNTFGANVLGPIANWLTGLWTTFGGPTVIGITDFITNVWETVGEPTLEAIFGFLEWAITSVGRPLLEDFLTFVKNVLDPNDGINILESAVLFFKDIIETFGSIGAGLPTFSDLGTFISNALNTVIDSVGQWVLDLINGLTGGFLTGISEALAAIVQWGTTLPLIGPLLAALIPESWRNITAQPASSLADLREYAAEQLNTSSVLYSGNLQGPIPTDLLPVISPGLVGDTTPNLVADPGFRAATAVQSGEGWSWDSTTSRTAGDGGSAKVAGDGGVKQMFSNLVAVSPGQSLQCSVYAKWTKSSAARPTIAVGLRTYNGDTVLSTFSVGSQASVVNNSAGWVQISGTYDIPASTPMTHARLTLSVLNAPAGTSVWFDEAALRKVSLIDQKLITGVGPNSSNLADDIENTVGSDDYQALLDRVAKKTGASLADVQATIEDFLDGDSEISGNQIKAGNIASTYINELRGTWDTIYKGVNETAPSAAGTIDSAFAALASWRTVIASQGGQSSGAVQVANEADRRVTALEANYALLKEYVGKMAVDIRAVTLAAGISPTTPPTPPGDTPVNFTSVNDNFDRASIGSGWSVTYAVPNSGALIIPDGNNAFFDPPDITVVQNVFTAIYTGGNSSTEYQRVFCTLGSGPGRPAVGSPGYNDLLGRVAGPTTCIVARFYNDFQRTVRLFWRTGGWEPNPYLPSNQFGVFNMPSDLTSGSVLEFYVGNKAGSDQTKCFVKVGTWTSGVATMNASALSVMGRGWGFGGGNGLSLLAAQDPGKVNFWGAQDQ